MGGRDKYIHIYIPDPAFPAENGTRAEKCFFSAFPELIKSTTSWEFLIIGI